MNCPYCNGEMEKGCIMLSSTGVSIGITVDRLVWYAEKDLENKKVKIPKEAVKIKEDENERFSTDSHYCRHCKKVFGEFSAV